MDFTVTIVCRSTFLHDQSLDTSEKKLEGFRCYTFLITKKTSQIKMCNITENYMKRTVWHCYEKSTFA